MSAIGAVLQPAQKSISIAHRLMTVLRLAPLGWIGDVRIAGAGLCAKINLEQQFVPPGHP
jgi:hypothetical protein